MVTFHMQKHLWSSGVWEFSIVDFFYLAEI
uniref:Uncharacterized protein n=1 Tax=Arundo donax TaxID=35708 RepID=A0A0A9GTS9_ARUDO